MKKLWLVSALSLGLILLAWCTTNKPVTIKNSDDMLAFYNNNKEMTCTMNIVDEEEWEAELYMYFKDWMLSQTSKITTLDWEVYNDFAVAKNWTTYWWWDSYGENWLSYDEDIVVEDIIWDFWDIEEWTTVTCVKWVKDNSVFDVPSDKEFISANDLFSWTLDDYYYDEYVEDWDEYVEDGAIVEENNEWVIEETIEEVTE